MSARPRPSFAKRAAFTGLMMLLTGLLIEGLPRLLWGPPPPGPGITRLARCHVSAAGLVCPGDRISAVDAPPRGPRPRLVLLGGSTVRNTFAPAARGDFAAPLAALLPGVEVLNFGLPGLSTAGVGQLAGQLEALNPDLVLIHTGHNDYNELVFSSAIPIGSRWQLALTQLLSRTWLRAAVGARTTPRGGPPPARDLLAVRGRTVLDEASARDARFRIELQAAIEASPAPVLLSTLMRNSHHPPQGQGVDGHPACPAALRDWQRRAHALPAWEADVARDCGEGPLLAWIHAQRTVDVERKRALLRAAYDADAAPLRAPARADDIIREVAAENNVPYVDLAELEGGVQPGRWFFDPLHTTEEGARAMAAALAPAVRAALPPAP